MGPWLPVLWCVSGPEGSGPCADPCISQTGSEGTPPRPTDTPWPWGRSHAGMREKERDRRGGPRSR